MNRNNFRILLEQLQKGFTAASDWWKSKTWKNQNNFKNLFFGGFECFPSKMATILLESNTYSTAPVASRCYG